MGTNLTSIVVIKSKAGGSLTPSLPSILKITVLLKGERAMAVKVSKSISSLRVLTYNSLGSWEEIQFRRVRVEENKTSVYIQTPPNHFQKQMHAE